jgi:two-component system, sensor histidine kinase and response regulator
VKSAPSGVDVDTLLAEAARLFSAPVALMGLLDEGGELIAGSRGWHVNHLPPAYSFATLHASNSSPLIVADTVSDARFSAHPLVTGPPHVRFYAGVPFVDADGELCGAISVLDSVTHAVTSEQEIALALLGRAVSREYALERGLDEANARFREFFEQTDDFVLSIGADGKLLHANEPALTMLGFGRGDLGRIELIKGIDPESRPGFQEAFRAVMVSGEPLTVETTFVTSSGRRITVEGSLRPKMVEGQALLARVVFRDITDRKQIEAELGSARDAALEAARLKTQFLTNVSHEIRTPMNGIVGMIDLLLSTPVTVEQQDYAHQARTSAEQLLAIVNNILYVSSIEAGSLSATAVDFDLYRTLQRVIEVMKIAALGKDIDVQLVYDDKVTNLVRGNQPRLRQVITNLMDNAVKFTEEGSVKLCVSLEKETDTHRVVRFEIRDTGIGIAPEDRLLLFEKFSQVEASSTRRYQGVGLGLATARQLVETMGGLIDVESAPGFGSTFWFSVPFPKQAVRRPVVSSDLEFKNKRVLLVDQYPTSRKIVRHYLEMTWEMRVEVTERAEEALQMLRASAADDPFRLAIYDNMPDLDAFSFARQVRADSAIGNTGLLYLAPAHKELNAEELRSSGINAFVHKPIGQGELFDAITLALVHDALPLARAAEQPADSRSIPREVPPEKRATVRVLVAEDNFLNMKLTMSQLHKLGYPADSVQNGSEALKAIEEKHYDIVLMDCQMPIIDGYQATIEIRRKEQDIGHRHRIIAMTANALEGDREKCLAAGMDDYLSKPTRHEELEIALARYFVNSPSDVAR